MASIQLQTALSICLNSYFSPFRNVGGIICPAGFPFLTSTCVASIDY